MKRFNKTYKFLLFGLLLVGLSSGIWQNFVPIFDIEELNGSVVKKDVVPFNLKNWFSGDYQYYIDDNIILANALSPFFVRVNNQIDYSLFDQLHMSGGLLGKEEYLYDQFQVDSYYGIDYMGEDKIRAYVEKIKFIQDTLKKLNKTFIYIQAPTKTSYYPEYLPDSLQLKESKQTNYQQLIKMLAEYNVNHIDFRPAFLDLKKKSVYPLFPQTGIHWSKYSTGLVMDSINNLIESNMKMDLPEIYWNEVELDYARHEDGDMEIVLNLIFKLSDFKYAYPKFMFEAKNKKDTPSVLMIGDSFLGNLYLTDFYKMFDEKSQFWYYNLSVMSPSFSGKKHRYQCDQAEVLKQSDVVILGCTESNIFSLSWAFIDDTYDYFKYGRSSKVDMVEFMKKVDSCRTRIVETDFEQINTMAKVSNISIDSAKTVYCIWKIQMSTVNNKK